MCADQKGQSHVSALTKATKALLNGGHPNSHWVSIQEHRQGGTNVAQQAKANELLSELGLGLGC